MNSGGSTLFSATICTSRRRRQLVAEKKTSMELVYRKRRFLAALFDGL
jgi:hypothetical protein